MQRTLSNASLDLPDTKSVRAYRERRILFTDRDHLVRCLRIYPSDWSYHYKFAMLLGFTPDYVFYDNKEHDLEIAKYHFQVSLQLLQLLHQNDGIQGNHINLIHDGFGVEPPPNSPFHALFVVNNNSNNVNVNISVNNITFSNHNSSSSHSIQKNGTTDDPMPRPNSPPNSFSVAISPPMSPPNNIAATGGRTSVQGMGSPYHAMTGGRVASPVLGYMTNNRKTSLTSISVNNANSTNVNVNINNIILENSNNTNNNNNSNNNNSNNNNSNQLPHFDATNVENGIANRPRSGNASPNNSSKKDTDITITNNNNNDNSSTDTTTTNNNINKKKKNEKHVRYNFDNVQHSHVVEVPSTSASASASIIGSTNTYGNSIEVKPVLTPSTTSPTMTGAADLTETSNLPHNQPSTSTVRIVSSPTQTYTETQIDIDQSGPRDHGTSISELIGVQSPVSPGIPSLPQNNETLPDAQISNGNRDIHAPYNTPYTSGGTSPNGNANGNGNGNVNGDGNGNGNGNANSNFNVSVNGNVIQHHTHIAVENGGSNNNSNNSSNNNSDASETENSLARKRSSSRNIVGIGSRQGQVTNNISNRIRLFENLSKKHTNSWDKKKSPRHLGSQILPKIQNLFSPQFAHTVNSNEPVSVPVSPRAHYRKVSRIKLAKRKNTLKNYQQTTSSLRSTPKHFTIESGGGGAGGSAVSSANNSNFSSPLNQSRQANGTLLVSVPTPTISLSAVSANSNASNISTGTPITLSSNATVTSNNTVISHTTKNSDSHTDLYGLQNINSNQSLSNSSQETGSIVIPIRMNSKDSSGGRNSFTSNASNEISINLQRAPQKLKLGKSHTFNPDGDNNHPKSARSALTFNKTNSHANNENFTDFQINLDTTGSKRQSNHNVHHSSDTLYYMGPDAKSARASHGANTTLQPLAEIRSTKSDPFDNALPTIAPPMSSSRSHDFHSPKAATESPATNHRKSQINGQGGFNLSRFRRGKQRARSKTLPSSSSVFRNIKDKLNLDQLVNSGSNGDEKDSDTEYNHLTDTSPEVDQYHEIEHNHSNSPVKVHRKRSSTKDSYSYDHRRDSRDERDERERNRESIVKKHRKTTVDSDTDHDHDGGLVMVTSPTGKKAPPTIKVDNTIGQNSWFKNRKLSAMSPPSYERGPSIKLGKYGKEDFVIDIYDTDEEDGEDSKTESDEDVDDSDDYADSGGSDQSDDEDDEDDENTTDENGSGDDEDEDDDDDDDDEEENNSSSDDGVIRFRTGKNKRKDSKTVIRKESVNEDEDEDDDNDDNDNNDNETKYDESNDPQYLFQQQATGELKTGSTTNLLGTHKFEFSNQIDLRRKKKRVPEQVIANGMTEVCFNYGKFLYILHCRNEEKLNKRVRKVSNKLRKERKGSNKFRKYTRKMEEDENDATRFEYLKESIDYLLNSADWYEDGFAAQNGAGHGKLPPKYLFGGDASSSSNSGSIPNFRKIRRLIEQLLNEYQTGIEKKFEKFEEKVEKKRRRKERQAIKQKMRQKSRSSSRNRGESLTVEDDAHDPIGPDGKRKTLHKPKVSLILNGATLSTQLTFKQMSEKVIILMEYDKLSVVFFFFTFFVFF